MRLVLVAFLSVLLTLPAVAGPIDKLTFYTEDFPPYQFVEDGELKGIFVDILREAFRQTETTKTVQDIHVVPWARGYNIVLATPNTVLFGTSRTAAREDKFLWVGPGTSSDHGILARKSDHHRIENLDQLNRYLTATIRDDVAEQLLLEGGVRKENLSRQSNQDSIVRLLSIKRADFWAYNITVAFHVLRKHGIADDYEVIFTLRKGQNWLALNLRSDPAAVAALQSAVDSVRRSPVYEEILARYR